MRPFLLLVFLVCRAALAQSTSSGTVIGTVVDPSGAVMANINVELRNAVTGYSQSAVTDGAGVYRFSNVPQSTYELEVSAKGFATKKETVNVVTTVPLVVNFSVEMSGERTTVEVTASGALIDTAPSARTDVDSSEMAKLPVVNAAAGLSSMINYSTGGTASDANGFFHPLGDHAQVSFVIDGQPINDQQSKVFSTQLPPNAIQSMELITGAPDAETLARTIGALLRAGRRR